MSHPKARLCHIQKWDHFDGYGFNLHAEKGKPGQYIGKVDEGSPSEAAGLRQGDRILEVNGESIANKTHKQVVELIKAENGETKLLVIDPEDDGIIPTEVEKNSEKQNDHPKKDKEQDNGQLNLSMTAAELRAKLAARKKFDPKKEAMDFKQKFDIVQKL
ncbi:Na(+)/H(+) exchange regulatory cofactor NHE-RF2 [Anoplophora glabripennis]|uniref:Na(+)/H(+) exchange regulatory cofactor NHE-RF2 n=1 Tax=Anoplophora glabripennis TaxID=217634 RepID=UPI000874B7F8|nr:Na(+)/H(+) exchange regulatory cofactor NHE-RF2 [Anoplophora glabripennis]